jgi:hypothetical protein
LFVYAATPTAAQVIDLTDQESLMLTR